MAISGTTELVRSETSRGKLRTQVLLMLAPEKREICVFVVGGGRVKDT